MNNDFSGIDINATLKIAEDRARKALQTRLGDWLTTKISEKANLRVKATKLRTDADKLTAEADGIEAILRAVASGDVSGIEPLEVNANKHDSKGEAKPQTKE